MSWKWVSVAVLSAGLLMAGSQDLERARDLYHRTDYSEALKVLTAQKVTDGRAWVLIGQCYFMMADYKKATDAFEKAVAFEPSNSGFVHWLGRAWGRRAETGSPLFAPSYASKARQHFERAVQLDPRNREALNDLFDYYLQAPGFLGGGFQKAQVVAQQIAALDSAEGHYAQAQLADRHKEFDQAEEQLRRAMELAPHQLGRVLDLAKYLSKRGRVQESEAAFARAEKMAPNSPRILYERAQTYIRDKRNLDEARQLLKRYISSQNLTVDDPPKSQAEELLRRAGA